MKYRDEEYRFYIERIGADKIREEGENSITKPKDIEKERQLLGLSPDATYDFILLCYYYSFYNAIRRL